MTRTSRRIVMVAVCSALGSAAAPAAETYPSKPIRFIVPYAPGGGADMIVRLVAPPLTEALKQQVIVDNRPGAGGNIGAEIAARAPADGYTIVLASANMAMNVTLFGRQSFDPVRDFSPVTLMASTPSLVVVHPSVPAKTLKDFIALARSTPGRINYASGGSGSTPHLTAELFKSMTGLNLVHVPYKGTAPAVIALISGEVPLTIVPALSVLPQVKLGKAHVLAITSVRRAPALPDVPTVAESGVPGYEASQWYGVAVPAKTSEGVITLLNSELVKIIRSPDFSARLVAEASIPAGTTPQQFGDYLKAEVVKWAKVVKQSGARVD